MESCPIRAYAVRFARLTRSCIIFLFAFDTFVVLRILSYIPMQLLTVFCLVGLLYMYLGFLRPLYLCCGTTCVVVSTCRIGRLHLLPQLSHSILNQCVILTLDNSGFIKNLYVVGDHTPPCLTPILKSIREKSFPFHLRTKVLIPIL